MANYNVYNKKCQGKCQHSLIYREQNGQRLYSLPAPNGNVVAITNPTGVVQERLNYSAFGQPTFHAPDMTQRTASDFAWNRTFTSQTYDPKTGMMHYRRRDYDPALGRFTNRDPIGYEANDVNLYRYVENKPINATDSEGTTLDTISGAVRGCMKLPTVAARVKCLKDIFSLYEESLKCQPNTLQTLQDALKQASRLTKEEAKKMAKEGKWIKTRYKTSKGEIVYDRGSGKNPRYVSYDNTGHGGGT
jgi:RHS repeat-associated protein